MFGNTKTFLTKTLCKHLTKTALAQANLLLALNFSEKLFNFTTSLTLIPQLLGSKMGMQPKNKAKTV
jgi:hypothetical protein